MDNQKEVVWTIQAVSRLKEILEYLSIKWTEREVLSFRRTLQQRIQQVQKFPLSGYPADESMQLRKILITPKNILLYQVLEERIIIHDIIDTRQLLLD